MIKSFKANYCFFVFTCECYFNIFGVILVDFYNSQFHRISKLWSIKVSICIVIMHSNIKKREELQV